MVPARLAAVLAGALLFVSVGCGKGGHGGSPTAPSSVGSTGAPPVFMDEGGHFMGAHPAPIVVGSMTYVYQNTTNPGAAVEASSDGLTFSLTPAAYPAGVSRTIVPLTDGRFRMYYFADATSADVQSVVSSDGLTWTVEPGARFSDPAIGAIRAIALPGGGYRFYCPGGGGLISAISSDGLTFTSEGPVGITPNDGAYTWGPSTAAYLNGQFHMVLTRTPSATGVSEFWHAISADGRNWTVDKSVMAANPGAPLNQPAWSINSSTTRVYYRAVLGGNSSVIGSGLIRF